MIIISPSNVVTFPEGGGHFWVYMQYVQALSRMGYEVYWLEEFQSSGDRQRDTFMLTTFFRRMKQHGLSGKALLYRVCDTKHRSDGAKIEFIDRSLREATTILRRADLLLNFRYSMRSELLSHFRHTALIDIDPGLLQFWLAAGQLRVAPHDTYFTIGETVGKPDALFPDCNLPWTHIQPPICLESWPYVFKPASATFTTVSSWWGGDGKGEFITDGKGICYENNKRVTFLQYADLPRVSGKPLELALNLGEGDADEPGADNPDAAVTDYVSDAADRATLLHHGWRLRQAYEVATTPEQYQAYIQQSRGEFSCVKPSCIKFQNAWISDRTICYLATGKPVVIQDTGPSGFLPNGEGMFRFNQIEEAVNALETINANYEKHCQAARAIAESHFDAKQILEKMLNVAQK